MKKGNVKKRSTNSGLVAVAVDKDKGSQHALKWAADNLVSKGQTIILLHVILRTSSDSAEANAEKHKQADNLFVTFHCYCSRKEIQCLDVKLEEENIVRSLSEYVTNGVIENLVLGAPSRHGFIRKFKMSDTPSHVAKAVPDFCTVYIISKGKISSVRNAARPAPYRSPLLGQIENQSAVSNYEKFKNTMSFKDRGPGRFSVSSSIEGSPMARTSNYSNSLFDSSDSENGTSFTCSGRPSTASSSRPSTASLGMPFKRPPDSFFDLPESENDISYVYSDRSSAASSGRPSTASSGRPSTASSGKPSAARSGMPFKRPPDSFFDLPDSENDISYVYSDRPSAASSGRPSNASSDRPSIRTNGRPDMSFVSSGRPSTSTIGSYDESGVTPRMSTGSRQSVGSVRLGIRFNDTNIQHEYSFASQDSGRSSCSCSPQNLEEVEAEMRRLKQELKHTLDMYGTVCREALAAKQEAKELQRKKMEEEGTLQEGKLLEKSTKIIVEKERATKAVVSQTQNKLAELETQKRAIEALSEATLRYRSYGLGEIEEATNSFDEAYKIGEGGYGPVYKGHLDHTPVAIKVLRPDAAQGRSQFQREVDVLSCIRHPHMVLLIGACPEYGVLVYEYMAKGSLADRLYRHGSGPPLSWELRFRIAAEVATGLLFLHQTKPEPIVHRDLKPGNILIDQNYVSKIGDVGLAKLVPAVAENVTQCDITSSTGTFCYIDPEYQQTGMLGVKSDVYSFGVLLLELLTAKNPTGLSYTVEQAVEQGTFKDMLDPEVPNWPVDEALSLAKIALKCAQLRRRDRPDLGKEVLPELNRLRALADANMEWIMFNFGRGPLPNHHSQMTLPPVDEMSIASDSSTTHSDQNEED